MHYLIIIASCILAGIIIYHLLKKLYNLRIKKMMATPATANPKPDFELRPGPNAVPKKQQTAVVCNHNHLIQQGIRIALKIIRDETHTKQEVPAWGEGNRKYKYTSVLASGWALILIHPKEGRHSFLVHSPSGNVIQLSNIASLEGGLDAAWVESELRLSEDGESTIKRIQSKEEILLAEAKKLLDEPEKK